MTLCVCDGGISSIGQTYCLKSSPKPLQNRELNISGKGAEAATQLKTQDFSRLTSRTSNDQSSIHARKSASKHAGAFKQKCGNIFKGSLLNISNARECIEVQDWLGPTGHITAFKLSLICCC